MSVLQDDRYVHYVYVFHDKDKKILSQKARGSFVCFFTFNLFTAAT